MQDRILQTLIFRDQIDCSAGQKHLQSTIKATNIPQYPSSYNVEMASKRIKLVRLTNFTEIYNLINEKKYDINNLTQNHLLYKQFVAQSCNGSSVCRLSDYMHSPVYQELISEDDYFDVTSDERFYLDLIARSGYVKETG